MRDTFHRSDKIVGKLAKFLCNDTTINTVPPVMPTVCLYVYLEGWQLYKRSNITVQRTAHFKTKQKH
jgi:uncharacterized membrane protein